MNVKNRISLFIGFYTHHTMASCWWSQILWPTQPKFWVGHDQCGPPCSAMMQLNTTNNENYPSFVACYDARPGNET